MSQPIWFPWIFSKDLELSLEVLDGSYTTLGDAESIGITLQNLVTNAANFSPLGGEVEVRLRESGHGEYVLSVRDHGPSIDEQKIERLFERFYSRDNPGGAGLGLSIVEMIVKRLRGNIELENQQPNGLLASLSIPCHGPSELF